MVKLSKLLSKVASSTIILVQLELNPKIDSVVYIMFLKIRSLLKSNDLERSAELRDDQHFVLQVGFILARSVHFINELNSKIRFDRLEG